jgi:hypothetical protein
MQRRLPTEWQGPVTKEAANCPIAENDSRFRHF